MNFFKFPILHSKLLWLVIFSLPLIWVSYWFFTHYERVSKTVHTGFQGPARSNPLLAAEYLLKRMGATVMATKTVPDLKKLEKEDTLILIQEDSALSEAQVDLLRVWITLGGHLIFVSDTLQNDEQDEPTEAEDEPSPDPLLTFLQVSQYKNDAEESDLEPDQPTQVTWQDYSLQVAFSPNYRLEGTRSPVLKIGDDNGIHLLTYSIGEGIVTVLSDLWFIENDAIEKYDHAQFLWHLVNVKQPVTRVWLVRQRLLPRSEATDSQQAQVPTLWQLLWLHGWTIILSVATLILFWLWFASRRFGPVLPEPPLTRRRLLEHIEASGHFLWQHGQAQRLWNATKQALMTRLKVVHPDWSRLSNQELSERLAQMSGWEEQEIEEVFNLSSAVSPFSKVRRRFFLMTKKSGRRGGQEAEFTRAVQILTQLRNAL